tara:strand:- start:966 stop:1340 length:375 start_codon:yes stop_codon:yes gene_type:complete
MNLKNLPLEIEDYIWNIYWSKIFKENVIKYLNDVKKIIKIISENLCFKKIIMFTDEKDKLIYLNKYNNLISYIGRDKGTLLFSRSVDKYLFFSFKKNLYQYVQYKQLEPVCNYIIIKSKIFHDI